MAIISIMILGRTTCGKDTGMVPSLLFEARERMTSYVPRARGVAAANMHCHEGSQGLDVIREMPDGASLRGGVWLVAIAQFVHLYHHTCSCCRMLSNAAIPKRGK